MIKFEGTPLDPMVVDTRVDLDFASVYLKNCIKHKSQLINRKSYMDF